MLPFKVHHLEVSKRHYLLLPKLNDTQMRVLAGRLGTRGFSASLGSTIVARSKRGSIYVDPAGLCWSFMDAEDIVLPVIPELLLCPKQAIPRRALAAFYLRAKGSLGRVVTRMESGVLWDSLRASGQCGLTPDEHAVALALLKNASDFSLLTDFPGSTPRPRNVGRRRYFETDIWEAEAASSLRMVGELNPRNAYLPRDGMFRPQDPGRPSGLEDSLSGLGEWCYYIPQ
jgi:hypothetical protein